MRTSVTVGHRTSVPGEPASSCAVWLEALAGSTTQTAGNEKTLGSIATGFIGGARRNCGVLIPISRTSIGHPDELRQADYCQSSTGSSPCI